MAGGRRGDVGRDDGDGGRCDVVCESEKKRVTKKRR